MPKKKKVQLVYLGVTLDRSLTFLGKRDSQETGRDVVGSEIGSSANIGHGIITRNIPV